MDKLSELLEKYRDGVGYPEGYRDFDYYAALAKVMEYELEYCKRELRNE